MQGTYAGFSIQKKGDALRNQGIPDGKKFCDAGFLQGFLGADCRTEWNSDFSLTEPVVLAGILWTKRCGAFYRCLRAVIVI